MLPILKGNTAYMQFPWASRRLSAMQMLSENRPSITF